ncbi:MAG: hypothetical protein BAA04_13600 [Firmicutes bacterium ZCTH02-B6]|nr:MAG: hypothetical protein BAA04_13600 [Firmicutes bacterium ZCTH02-B6]
MDHNGRLEWLRADLQAMERRITERIDRLERATTERLNDHAKRIRALETSRAYVAGIGAALGWLATWLKDLIAGKGGTP